MDPEDRTHRTFVSPSTRRLARELGVDLGAVEGTGTGGRVTESDVERAFETVGELTTVGDVDVGFVDLLVGAAVRALERLPEFNAWYEGETHRLIAEVNVAVAVDAEVGLLTPVVREASDQTLAGIARERRRLTEAVLEGRHELDDLQGGTFTVSNLGPLGVDSFDPTLDTLVDGLEAPSVVVGERSAARGAVDG